MGRDQLRWTGGRRPGPASTRNTTRHRPIPRRNTAGRPLIYRWQLHSPRLDDGILKVGPRGLTRPQPAMRVGQGPTVTDADVVLGYIDPNCFLAGRIKLDAERSRQAIRGEGGGAAGREPRPRGRTSRRSWIGFMGQEVCIICAMISGRDQASLSSPSAAPVPSTPRAPPTPTSGASPYIPRQQRLRGLQRMTLDLLSDLREDRAIGLFSWAGTL